MNGREQSERNRAIRARRAAGERVADIARDLGISAARIYALTGTPRVVAQHQAAAALEAEIAAARAEMATAPLYRPRKDDF